MKLIVGCISKQDKSRAIIKSFYVGLPVLYLILCPGHIFGQVSGNLISPADLKKLSIEELMNIEVASASKRPVKLIQSSTAIQVITQDDIRQSGATNIPEALRLAPNLQVAQVNSSQWAISARGFNNVLANKLLVLIDGRVVYTPLYAGVFWDVQNLILEDIERIEVLSGPGGTMWGANAVNGVINIITKTSKDTKGLFLEAGMGTALNGLGSIRYGGNITDKISYRVYGTAFKRDNTDFRDSIEADDNWKMAQTGVRLDWEVSDKDLIMLQSNLYDNRPDPDGGHPVLAQGSNVLGRWNHAPSGQSEIQVQLFYDHTFRDFRNGFTEKLNTYDVEGQHRFKIGQRQEVIYGLGFRFMDHEVKNLGLFAFLPARKSLYLYNAFLQDYISLIQEQLHLTIGLKIEHNTYTKFQYQPNVRLDWMPTAQHTIWTAVSRALRNPARIDREFFLYLTPELPLIAGSDFRSEEVIANEAGWRFQPSNHVSFSISVFFNMYDNLRSVEPGPPPFNIPYTFGNGVKGNSYGAEFSMSYQLKASWYLRGGYTYLAKDLSIKSNSSDLNNGTAESNDPSHQLLIQSNMDFAECIELGTVVRYISELPEPEVDAYVGLDIRLAWKINEIFELNVTGQNLLYKNHTEFVPSSPAPKDIERSVYVKGVCRF